MKSSVFAAITSTFQPDQVYPSMNIVKSPVFYCVDSFQTMVPVPNALSDIAKDAANGHYAVRPPAASVNHREKVGIDGVFKVQAAQTDNVVKAKLPVPPKSYDEGENP